MNIIDNNRVTRDLRRMEYREKIAGYMSWLEKERGYKRDEMIRQADRAIEEAYKREHKENNYETK
jgi:hypothetical protein